MTAAILYPILACGLYYLGFWAKVTETIWRHYSPTLASFMGCAACSGFWYGVLVACVVGRLTEWSYLGIPWYNPLAAGISGMVAMMTTPVLATFHLRALSELHAAITTPAPPDDAPPKD